MTIEIITLKDADECYEKLCNLMEYICTSNSNIRCSKNCPFHNSKGKCTHIIIASYLDARSLISNDFTSDEWEILYNTIMELTKTKCRVSGTECDKCVFSKSDGSCVRIKIRNLFEDSSRRLT